MLGNVACSFVALTCTSAPNAADCDKESLAIADKLSRC